MAEADLKENNPLTRVQCLAWGAGGMADNFLAWTVAYLVIPIYNIALGVDPVVIGWGIALPRLLDGILNPISGHLSDNFRSRWGRRRPFILLAGLVSIIFFAAAWMPPVRSSSSSAALYFFVTTFLYLGVYGFFAIPYYALGVELTTDYHERTRVQTCRFFFTSVSQLLLPWFYKVSIRIGSLWPSGDIKPELIGIRYVTGLIAAVSLLIVILIFVFCRESGHIQSQPKINFLAAFAATFKNDVFVRMAIINLLTLFGILSISPLGMYLGIYYVCQGDKDFAATLSGLTGMVVGTTSILALSPLTSLSRRFGKKAVFIGGQLTAVVGYLAIWVLLTPEHPYWGIIPWIFIAPGQLTVWVIGSSIGADVIDLDELKTGLRREGSYSAIASMLSKAIIGLSSIASGYVIVWSGFVQTVTPSAEVLLRMRILFVVVPVAFTLASIILIGSLPISQRRMLQVRDILNARRANANTSRLPDVDSEQPAAASNE
jgi:GPH family glycoside/pentoside/hexuronide:cation symporter